MLWANVPELAANQAAVAMMASGANAVGLLGLCGMLVYKRAPAMSGQNQLAMPASSTLSLTKSVSTLQISSGALIAEKSKNIGASVPFALMRSAVSQPERLSMLLTRL
jgi:hypothetical protein